MSKVWPEVFRRAASRLLQRKDEDLPLIVRKRFVGKDLSHGMVFRGDHDVKGGVQIEAASSAERARKIYE